MEKLTKKRALYTDEEVSYLSAYADAYAVEDFPTCRNLYRQIVELTGSVAEADRIAGTAKKMSKVKVK